MMFHLVQFSAAVHRDLMQNRIVWSSSRDTLMHKGVAIRLLKHRVASAHSDPVSLRAVSMAVGFLATHELDEDVMASMANANPLPLEALLPPPPAMRVWAQLEPRQEHLDALRQLVSGKS
jgi:hypothetical protein